MAQTAAVCLFVKNEVEDLAEWVDHHARLGFNEIHVYDDLSTDGTTSLLEHLSQTYPLVVHTWDPPLAALDGRTRQVTAYTHACHQLAKCIDWVLFIDADEFLLPPALDSTIADLLERHVQHAAFTLNWKIFGSRDLDETAGQLILAAFDRRAPLDFGPNQHVKMFCRPDRVTQIVNPHFAETNSLVVDVVGRGVDWLSHGITTPAGIVSGDWQLHHYLTRSKAHWERRVARRQVNGLPRDWEMFAAYDRNEIVDRKGVKWSGLVRDSLAKVGIFRSVNPIRMASPVTRRAIEAERERFLSVTTSLSASEACV